jgi:hypothetical protein
MAGVGADEAAGCDEPPAVVPAKAGTQRFLFVMAGLDPAIHLFLIYARRYLGATGDEPVATSGEALSPIFAAPADRSGDCAARL